MSIGGVVALVFVAIVWVVFVRSLTRNDSSSHPIEENAPEESKSGGEI